MKVTGKIRDEQFIHPDKNIELTTGNNDNALVRQFRSLLEKATTSVQDDCNITSVSFYAERLSVLPDHLNLAVIRVTGKTAGLLIQEQIIARAGILLTKTSLSVEEIAYALSFDKLNHFMVPGTTILFWHGAHFYGVAGVFLSLHDSRALG